MKHKVKMSVFLKTVAALATASFFLAACDSNQDRGTGILANNPPDLTQQDNIQNTYFLDRRLVTYRDYYFNPNDTSNLIRLTGIGGRSEYTANYYFETDFFVDKFRLIESRSQIRNSFCNLNQPEILEMSLIDRRRGSRTPVVNEQDIFLERNSSYLFQVRYRPWCNSVDWQFNPFVLLTE